MDTLFKYGTGGENRTPADGFGDRRTTIIRHPLRRPEYSRDSLKPCGFNISTPGKRAFPRPPSHFLSPIISFPCAACASCRTCNTCSARVFP